MAIKWFLSLIFEWFVSLLKFKIFLVLTEKQAIANSTTAAPFLHLSDFFGTTALEHTLVISTDINCILSN